MKPILLSLALVLAATSIAGAKVKKPLLPARELEPVTMTPEPATTVPEPGTTAAESFNPEDAASQVRARMGGVRACYQRASRLDPGLRGKLQLGFDIADSGQIAAMQIEVNGLRVDANFTGVSTLTACIRSQAQSWRLSPEGSTGGAHISYVFVFESAH